jgi:hypothetical protein
LVLGNSSDETLYAMASGKATMMLALRNDVHEEPMMGRWDEMDEGDMGIDEDHDEDLFISQGKPKYRVAAAKAAGISTLAAPRKQKKATAGKTKKVPRPSKHQGTQALGLNLSHNAAIEYSIDNESISHARGLGSERIRAKMMHKGLASKDSFTISEDMNDDLDHILQLGLDVEPSACAEECGSSPLPSSSEGDELDLDMLLKLGLENDASIINMESIPVYTADQHVFPSPSHRRSISPFFPSVLGQEPEDEHGSNQVHYIQGEYNDCENEGDPDDYARNTALPETQDYAQRSSVFYLHDEDIGYRSDSRISSTIQPPTQSKTVPMKRQAEDSWSEEEVGWKRPARSAWGSQLNEDRASTSISDTSQRSIESRDTKDKKRVPRTHHSDERNALNAIAEMGGTSFYLRQLSEQLEREKADRAREQTVFRTEARQPNRTRETQRSSEYLLDTAPRFFY